MSQKVFPITREWTFSNHVNDLFIQNKQTSYKVIDMIFLFFVKRMEQPMSIFNLLTVRSQHSYIRPKRLAFTIANAIKSCVMT